MDIILLLAFFLSATVSLQAIGGTTVTNAALVLTSTWPDTCTCRELMPTFVYGCRRGFCNIQAEGLGIEEQQEQLLLEHRLTREIKLPAMKLSRESLLYLHLKIQVSRKLEMEVSTGGKVWRLTLNSSKENYISVELPVSSESYETIFITLKSFVINTFKIQTEILVTTEDVFPALCEEMLCEHPKVTDLTVTQNSTTAIFNCNATGHPILHIMWNMPPGLTSVAVGTQLIVTQLGPQATGTYQCFVTNNIGCDHKEINLKFNVSSVSIATSSNTAASVIDTLPVNSSSTSISPTPSSSAFHTLLVLVTSHISSSSAFIGPISSTISYSSLNTLPVIDHLTSNTNAISHVTSSSEISVMATNLACDQADKSDLLLVTIILNIIIVALLAMEVILIVYITRRPTKISDDENSYTDKKKESEQ